MQLNCKLLRVLLLHFTLMGIAFMSLLVFFFTFLLPIITKNEQFITVPDLTGIDVDELGEWLTQRGLRFKVNQEMGYDAGYPSAVVLKQHPQPGASVKEGRRIYLTLNAAQPPAVCMPNLVDGSLRNAHVLLTSCGLSCGSIEYVPDIAQNAVLEQQYKGHPIAPGTRIVRGAQIDLVIGAGLSQERVTIPDVIGMSLSDAELVLLDAGIRIGSVTHKLFSSSQQGAICYQVPASGRSLRLGETVDLWVSADDKSRNKN